jgi:hypothetical protein
MFASAETPVARLAVKINNRQSSAKLNPPDFGQYALKITFVFFVKILLQKRSSAPASYRIAREIDIQKNFT